MFLILKFSFLCDYDIVGNTLNSINVLGYVGCLSR